MQPAPAPVEDGRGLAAELGDLGTFGKAWTLTVVVLCAVRAAVAWPALVRFGLDPWWFVVLDVGTAPTYGIGQAMAVKILRSDRPARAAVPWIVMVLVSFVAPYLYVLLAAGHLPGYVVAGVIAWMALFGALSAARIIRESRR